MSGWKDALEERRLPAPKDDEAAAQEGGGAKLSNDRGAVPEHVTRRDHTTHQGPEEVIASPNGDSVSRASENDPAAADPETEPAIESPATVPSNTPSPSASK